MKQTPTTNQWLLLGGGAALIIGTFLDWGTAGPFGVNGLSGDNWWGIFAFLIALAILAAVALPLFTEVSLPDEALGFSQAQLILVLAFFELLLTLGYALSALAGAFFDPGIGVILGVVASGAMLAGAYLELGADARPASATPPTPF